MFRILPLSGAMAIQTAGADTEDPLVIARRFRETNGPYPRHGNGGELR
jgi:hypothetical protein